MNKKYLVIKLHFHSGLHIGLGKSHYSDSDTILHSDSIAAALHVAARNLWGDFANDFSQQLSLSSAFPFAGEELYLPKPMIKLPPFGDVADDEINAKKFKRIRYISKDYFEKLINDPMEPWKDAKANMGGAFISKIVRETAIIKSEIQERVFIPMDSADSLPYSVERLHFASDAGLYFMLNAEQDVLLRLQQCLAMLGDQGLGTDRSVGNGQFTFTISEITFRLPESNYGVLLSMYSPRDTEYTDQSFLDEARYNLHRRGGFISSPAEESMMTLQKNSIYMFGEGSVFKDYTKYKGEIKNLQPDERVNHPVWRDGRAFFLPCLIS